MMPALVKLWNPNPMPFCSPGRLFALLALLSLPFLAGCSTSFGFPGVYRIDVEQGNIVTDDMVDQLKPGMSQRQVRFIMGTPLIEDTFHPERWDYRYTVRNGTRTLKDSRLTVWFEGDKLVDVTGSYVPEWAGQPSADSTDDNGEASTDN